jgi:penicillin G amidase
MKDCGINNRLERMRVSLILAIFFSACTLAGCASIFLSKGFPQIEGEASLPGLSGSVEVIRDHSGIPHIYAGTEQDLLMAQGYVHAQDRLWQMETFRRVASGTLSEVGGREMVDLDHWMRLIGLSRIRSLLAGRIMDEQKPLAEAYLKGINAFIDQHKNNLPIEFRNLGIVPKPWKIEDLYNVVGVNAWFLETNFAQEILALAGRKHFGTRELKDLLPSWPGAVLPEDSYFETLRGLALGNFIPEVESLYKMTSTYDGLGSNNWVTAKGPGGKPLLENDPHLALLVPGVWYFCHMESPGYRIAGASMAGIPGIVIGHNDRLAWGWTNVMTDVADLYVFRVDPKDPTTYYVKDQALKMKIRDEVYGLSDGSTETRRIYETVHGPVITEVRPGVNAVAALKWYGTLPDEKIFDESAAGILKLNRAGSVREGFEAGRHFGLIGQNLVLADIDGNIGWHAFGKAPLRKGYSGRLPADGSAGESDWVGYLPYDKMPSSYNPEKGFIATANNRPDAYSPENPITYDWCAPYRYQRISQVLSSMKETTPDSFRNLQKDVHSFQADSILPKLAGYQFTDKKAREAQEILLSWDREVRPQSAGAAVYEVFLTEWVRALLEDELGDHLKLYYHLLPAAFLVQDVILDRPDSPAWDNVNTAVKETPHQVLEMALRWTYERLEDRLGPDAITWDWGRLHTYYFAHPGARSKLEHKLLSRGPIPAAGDNSTVNAACFDPSLGGYGVIVIPSLRMIAPLNDLDKTTIAGPMGQSGQPGNPHYDDLIKPWMSAEGVPLYFNRADVDANAVSKLILRPGQAGVRAED